MTADRTSIRRRLAIRGRSHRPPWGARKAGHDSILAPLVATVAATVAVGVGLALARSERERRRTRQRQLERRLALAPRESLAEGLRRMALAQTDLAIELLSAGADAGPANGAGPPAAPDERAVHETRKALKRLRALLRLLRHELGEHAYARESAALRDIAARLSSARDAAVMLSTLDGLIQRHPRKLGRRDGVLRLRRRLLDERRRVQQGALSDPAERAHVLGALHAFRWRVATWRLRPHDGIELVDADLERLYRQGRARYRRVLRRKGDRLIAMHQWRKRVKDLRYAAEMLDRRDAAGNGGGSSSSSSSSGARLRRLARRADELGELLGEEHDLAIFAQRLRVPGARAEERTWHTGRRTRTLLLELIARRRRKLRRRALQQGNRLYREKPGRFMRRVRAAYAAGARQLS